MPGVQLITVDGHTPDIADAAWVAPGAVVAGRVTIGSETGVWYTTVVRADTEAVSVGEGTSLQDGTVVHADPGFPTTIGDGVTVGHRAVVHGCTVEDDCLVGMGAVILNGATIGRGSIVAAEALCRWRHPRLGDIDPATMIEVAERSGAIHALGRRMLDECLDALAEWREALADFSGQWAVVQDTLEAASDPQTVANGYIGDCATADGTAFKLVTSPMQFGGEPHAPKRAPEFNEHGDEILESIGLDMDAIIDLKVRGVVA